MNGQHKTDLLLKVQQMEKLTDYLKFAKAEAEKGDDFHLKAALDLKTYPVGIREFVTRG